MKEKTRKFKIISQNGDLIDIFETVSAFKTMVPTGNSFKMTILGYHTLPIIYSLTEIFKARIEEIKD